MIDQLGRGPEFEIESWVDQRRERIFRAKPKCSSPMHALNPDIIRHLMLCRDIVQHVLPQSIRDELQDIFTTNKSLPANTTGYTKVPESFAAPLTKGSIDYTAFQSHLAVIQDAICQRQLCTVNYTARLGVAPKSYIVAPLLILAFREALYLRCIICSKSGQHKEDSARTFAIHRMRAIKQLDEHFSDLADPEETGAFGFPFHSPLQIRVAFSPEVATYVSERQWSTDQHIRKRKGGGILLTFTTTSKSETLAWILGFGPNAELLEPKELRDELVILLQAMESLYQ